MEECQLHLFINRLKHPLLAIIAFFFPKKSQEVILSVFVFYFICMSPSIMKSLCNIHVCLPYIISSISRPCFPTY